jgi:phage-related protein
MKTIPLTKNRFAMVDDDDFDKLSKHKWCVNCCGWGSKYLYAQRGKTSGGKIKFLMHRVIMNAKKGQEIDHIDGNGLNNQKSNLRFVTRTQNQMNRIVQQVNNHSGFKGVCWDNKRGKWLAQIRVKTKTKFLGHFTNAEDAGKAYDDSAKIYFGEFARLNKTK